MAVSECGSYTDVMLHESKAHGSTYFPAACYEEYFPEINVPAHWHTEMELVRVLKGRLRLTVNGKPYDLAAGSGAFINQDILHAAESADPSEKTAIHSIVFHPNLIAPDRESVFWQKYVDPLTQNDRYPVQMLDSAVSWQSELLTAHERAWSAIAFEPEGYEFLARNELSRIVLLLYTHQRVLVDDDISNLTATNRADEKRSRRNVKRVKEMLSFIREHYFEQISLEEIAAAGMVSKSECNRCFREVLDTTPIRFLNRYRLQTAAQYLRETDWRVSEIGFRCGFSEMGYFASEFRKVYGRTPGEYRRTD